MPALADGGGPGFLASPRTRAGLRRITVFLGLFLLLLGLFCFSPLQPPLADAGAGLLGRSAEWLLAGTRFAPAFYAPYLWVPGSPDPLVITADCVALPAFATLIALEAVAARGPWRKGVGMVTVSLLYGVLNSFRIVSLVVLMEVNPEVMSVVHAYLWNGVQFLVVTSYVVFRLSGRVD
ncbi:MAG: hypothetical protein GC201_05840 [Alphaproteobacteria bacterium]|nr:hypothetical protein [Alphaproteobacteria bacterium]